MIDYFQQWMASLALSLPNILAGLAILVIGLLLAIVVAAIVRSLLHRVTLDERLAGMIQGDQPAPTRRINTEAWISWAVFWLIILATLVVFLQRMNLTAISSPLGGLLASILDFVPRVLGALILLFIAWLLATFLRVIVTRLLSGSGLARRLSTDAQVPSQDRINLGQTLGNIVYWLVFLFFLPAVLDALDLQGILVPVQRMLDEILGVLPNLLAAAVILAIGWLVARIVRQIVANLLAGVGVDRLGGRGQVGSALGEQKLSDVIATIVYVLILIPVAIAALNALNIPAISTPASNMLNSLLNALPAVFGAFLLLAIAWFIANIAGTFVARILSGIGFNRLFASLGLFRASQGVDTRPAAEAARQTAADMTGQSGASGASVYPSTGPGGVTRGRLTPSEIAGYLVTAAILLFAVMEAADLLGFDFLALLVSRFIVVAGQVLAGLVIFGIGLFLSSWAERVIRASGSSQAYILAPAARAAIIIFSAALALREMGIAESIVNLAFGLLLGAVAVAAALAFGLGGRDIAGRQLERWTQDLRSMPPGPGSDAIGSPPRPAEPDKG